LERLVIRFVGASLGYGSNRPALLETNLEIGPGLSLLLGPNGAGKSSLLKLAAGVERPMTGQVLVDGLDLWVEEVASRQLLAYVPEQPDLSPYVSLEEVARLVCRLRGEPLESGASALDRTGLAAVTHRTVRELSMGQRRRALLAMAFIGHPTHVLLDEPLDGMDREIRDEIVAWVGRLAGAGAVVLISTHETGVFAALATRVVAVRDGCATMVEELPVQPTDRAAHLEALARDGRA
jgi:ABC-2 type transport system ATP-binding protein